MAVGEVERANRTANGKIKCTEEKRGKAAFKGPLSLQSFLSGSFESCPSLDTLLCFRQMGDTTKGRERACARERESQPFGASIYDVNSILGFFYPIPSLSDKSIEK